ncbi:hypothetical protein FGRMN_5051 [Fusarium graminum]|nr:hypothetical protein FGRMN_5051 [Fusarium graminum]
MASLIDQSCTWARAGDGVWMTEWFKLPAEEREMTSQFRSLLTRINIQEQTALIFMHMPRKVQKQLFAKLDLTPILAKFSSVRVGINNITRAQGVKGGTVKILKPGARFKKTMTTKVYLGSAISKLGAYTRIQAHEEGANGKSEEKSLHYDFSQRADVILDFRIVGIWSNPHVIDFMNADNDIQRWPPTFLEGVMMVSLGLVHRDNMPLIDRTHNSALSSASYTLIEELRSGLKLLDFHGGQKCPLFYAFAFVEISRFDHLARQFA